MYSIVIPVYQAKACLGRCALSWLAQTERDLELILVDDGSTDGSAALCDRFAERDGRVKVIHQKNAGVSAARNAGIRAASGEFLLFTDSDDYVEPDYLEKMGRLQKESGSDLVLCGYHHLYEGSDILKIPGRTHVSAVGDFSREFLMLYQKSYLNMPWNKLFKREWAGQFDTSLSLGEDLLFNLAYLKKCRRVAVLAEPLCWYVQDTRRVTLSSQKREDRLLLARRLCEETEQCYKEIWGQLPGGPSRIFTRYMEEVLDECGKLPADKSVSRAEKLQAIRAYSRDAWVRQRGDEALYTHLDHRILWFFLKRGMARTVYILCVLRGIAAAAVHRMRKKRQ